MKKRLLTILLAMVLTVSILPNQTFATTITDKPDRENGGVNVIKHAFNEKDIENKFKDYSKNKEKFDIDESLQGRIIGLVYDQNTGEAIPNAKIRIEGWAGQVKTDDEGRFEIVNVPDGYYTVTVEINGYEDAVYKNMPVTANFGSNVYSLAISTFYEVDENYLDDSYSDQPPYIESIDGEAQLSIERNYSSDTVTATQANEMTIFAAAAYTTPTLTEFTVCYNGTIKSFNGNNMNDYLYYVVANEMLPEDSSHYNGITYAQKLEAFKAQAIAARTYADYIATYYTGKHDQDGYTMCSTTDCQVYKPSNTNTLTIEAVNATTSQIVYDTINDKRVEALFSASCTGSTKNSEDVFPSAKSYLRAVPCPYDIRPELDLGHNVGLCQDGAAGYAKNGYTCNSIITHYYTGTSIITAYVPVSTPHVHSGNPTSGGGCFTIPVYHTHTGSSTTGGGCYVAVPHVHTGSPTTGGGCYVAVPHVHTGSPTTGGGCYVAIPHTHSTACYGPCGGTIGSPNTSTTTNTCPRCRHNTMITYTWSAKCSKCNSIAKSGIYKVCPYPSCNYVSGSAPSGGGTCSVNVQVCSKTIDGYTCSKTIDGYTPCSKTIDYYKPCSKIEGFTIDYYNPSCGYN